MGIIEKVTSKLRREAGVAVVRTYVYKREHTDLPAPEVVAQVDRVARVATNELENLYVAGFDDQHELTERFERGDECYGAWIGPDLVHYSWVQTHGTRLITAAGVEIPIGDGELWIYNCRTSELYRGRGSYPRTLQHILGVHFSAGARTAWIDTAEHNISSQRGIERAGFTHVQTLRALRVGRRYRALSSDGA